MPRKALIQTNEFPYHITNRSNNKDFFYLKMDELWPIFLDRLTILKTEFKCQIHAFILMHNHYHLVLTTPNSNLAESMKYFHREIARISNRSTNRINHFFGGRYKWSLIRNEHYYWNCIKYVYQNPLRAGIYTSVDDYVFSTLSPGKQKFFIGHTNPFSFADSVLELDRAWLNQMYDPKENTAIKRALRRREFEVPIEFVRTKVKLNDVRNEKGTITF